LGEDSPGCAIRIRESQREKRRRIQGFAYTGAHSYLLDCARVHRTEKLWTGFFSRDAGGRTARWKFEAVGQIVRLLDTIEAPGSPGHLSRPSDEG